MKNSLSSLALLQHYYSEGNDIIKAFLPLIIYILAKQNESEITVEEIKNLFHEEYGINIPSYPLETMLNRLRPKFIYRQSGKIKIIKAAISEASFGIRLTEERRNLDSLLNDFVNFSKKFVQPIDISLIEADELFSDFIKSHDSELLFALTNGNCTSLFDCGNTSKDPDKVYLLNRYINDQLSTYSGFSNFIVHAALGHLFSSTILYRDFLNVRGNAVCKNCYLDSNILFDIFGINGSFRKNTSRQFIAELIDMGTNIKLFNHNYHEFLEILEGCIPHIQSSDYKVQKASRALLYFTDNGYTKDEVQIFIGLLPKEINELGIALVEKPNPNKYQEYQIDREVLKKCILDVYKAGGVRQIDENEKNKTIERDIDSIESIYKLRGDNVPISIGEVSDVLLTTNTGLAHASMLFQRIEKGKGYFSIPTVITDVFLGTMIWIQAPSDLAENYSRSKMITYTNAAIQPGDQLMDKLSLQIEKAIGNEKQPMSRENARVLIETSYARRTLSDATLNDDERVTAETPYDLLRAVEKELTAEPLKKILELERIEEQKTGELIRVEGEAEKYREKFIGQNDHLEGWIAKTTKKIRIGVLVFLLIIMATVLTLQFMEIIPPVINKVIGMIITVLGFVGFTILGVVKKAEEALIKRLKSMLITN